MAKKKQAKRDESKDKVTLTISENEEGGISFTLEFDPPLANGQKMSQVQQIGNELYKEMLKGGGVN